MAKARERNGVRLLGTTGRRRSDLLLSTALQAASLMVLALPGWAQPAPNALPTGGKVVAGSATIANGPGTTTINQASQRAAINWQSFNIGANGAVTFAQPSASAIALNRVVGPDPSQIAGHLNANGQIVLVNPAGVTFYKGAQVNVQSLIVSTANISNKNFMAGRMAFTRPGKPNASVTNAGTITVKQAGLAALVAPNVANSGVIDAKLGHVVLAGAKTATLDLYGDGLLALDVTNQVTQAPIGPNGKTVTALVTNSGVIEADGGTVRLTAAAADGVLQNLVRAGGTISANTVGSTPGTVTVDALGGSVSVTGVLNAIGTAPGATGGAVVVNASDAVAVGRHARIDVSGAAGGGVVAIGTTLQRAVGGPGTAASQTAARVDVRRGATIAANATGNGNAGRVTVLSTGETTMSGTISATGGAQGGDGGFVEVSGSGLMLTGSVDVAAPAGSPGTFLMDPGDLAIIGSIGANDVGQYFINGTLLASSPSAASPPSTLFNQTIDNAKGTVVIASTGTIDVLAPISVHHDLTLQAGSDLTLENGGGLTAVGNIALFAGGDLTINAGAPVSAGGNVVLQSGPSGAIAVNSPVIANNVVQMIAGTGGIALNGDIAAFSLDLNATGGGVTQTITTSVTAAALFSSLGVTGDVSLLGSGNAFSEIDNFAVAPAAPGTGNFQLVDTGPLSVVGTLSATSGNVYLEDTSGGGISISQGSIATAGTGLATFQTDSFNVFGGQISTGTFELAPFSSGTTLYLGNQGEVFGPIVSSLTGINSTAVRFGAATAPAALGPQSTAAAIQVGGSFDALNRAMELDATGTIDGTGGSLVAVGTLSGTGGDWSLPLNNSIDNLGDVTATSLSLNDTVPLTVIGTLNAGTSATITDTGLLTISSFGTVTAAAVALTADNIDIAGFVLSPGLVTLNANAGTISETGGLTAGILVGKAGGTVDLSGANPSINQVATLGDHFAPAQSIGGFSASGFTLRDGEALTVDGPVTATSATGQVFLRSVAAGGITIAANGAVRANATTGLASIQADAFVNNASVTAGTIELAPATSGGTVTLGSTGSGLSLPGMTGLVTNNLVVGAVTDPGAAAPTIVAGGIAIAGGFTFAASGTLTLNATGAVAQTAPLTDTATLSGTAGSFILTNPGNTIAAAIDITATDLGLEVVSSVALAAADLAAPGGSVFLSSADPAGVTIEGPVSANGRVGVQADAFALEGGGVTANTFELAPATTGGPITLGASPGGTSLMSLAGIYANTVVLGGVTLPGAGSPSITAGTLTVAGAFDATGIGTLELLSRGTISQTAPLTNVATLSATGASVTLDNTSNQIISSSGITATTGDIVLIDGVSLTLNGAYSGGDLLFEVAGKGGALTVGGNAAATLAGAAGGRITLVADAVTANTTGAIGSAGGTVELAPFSAINESLAGNGGNGMTVNTALLGNINVAGGTLVVGGFTASGGDGTFTTTAASITLDGAVNLGSRVGTLNLLASGSITEPGGPLTVTTVTGAAGDGDFSLNNPANLIQASTGMTATGSVVLADDPTLQLTGTYTGANLFFQVTQAGGTLAVGDAQAPASLTVTSGGIVSLAADQITATASSTITAPAGTVELAPFSAINESVLGTNSAGQLLIGATLLGDISVGSNAPGTLVIGGHTSAPSDTSSTSGPSGVTSAAIANGPTASAGSVTLDGVVNLTTLVPTLDLLSRGSVTEPGGPLSVTNVTGASSGTFALTNPANAISDSLGITASQGDVVLVNGGNLTLMGAHSGDNLFFQVATVGGVLTLGTNVVSGAAPVFVTATNGGRISLVADEISGVASSTLTASAGTLEVAPFSPLNVSLLGTAVSGALVIFPAFLPIITPGLETLRIGGYTNEAAGSTALTVTANNLVIGGTVTLAPLASGIDLEGTGAITQTAPLVAVGTLTAHGGSVTLTDSGNQIATGSGITASSGAVALVDASDLTLNGTYSGTGLFFEVARTGGTLTIGGTAAATLNAASGGLIALVADDLIANTAGAIGEPGGTVDLAPFSPINVSLGGSGGNGMTINAALLADIDVGTGTLLVGAFTPPTSTTTTTASDPTTAASISIDGPVNLGTRVATLDLEANGPITEPGGPVSVATLTGTAATGDFSLLNPANQVQTALNMTALEVALIDGTSLQVLGAGATITTAQNMFFEVAAPGGTLTVVDAISAAGDTSLVADNIAATSQGLILAAGTIALAPFSARDVSLGGTGAPGVLTLTTALLSHFRGGAKGEDLANVLTIGGYIAPRATQPSVTAANITIDGSVDVGGAATLNLLTNGAISEPGGPLAVPTISATSTAGVNLANSGNGISEITGITASNGDITVIDDVSGIYGARLTLLGHQSGNNLFFEVASPGGTLALGNADLQTKLTAASGGRITLVADQMTENPGGAITAPGGTLELAPFSAINTSLAGTASSGQLLIDPTMLSLITPGVSTLVVGGYTNVPAGATAALPSASGISVDGTVNLGSIATTLDLLTTGAVTQAGPLLNVGTLIGTTGSTTLTDPGDSIATLGNYTAPNGFALTNNGDLLIAGTLNAGSGALLIVAGTLTETGGIVAAQLGGSAIGSATLTGANNIAVLNGFSVSGANSSFTLHPGGNLLVNGTVSATRITLSSPTALISLGNGSAIVTGGNLRPAGAAPPASLLPANGGAGALLQAANVTQTGLTTVTGLNGGPATLQISVTGDITFDPRAGISGPNTWLILNLTSGTATGNIAVRSLDVFYDATGSTRLTGSVNDISGLTAAGLGYIAPALNTNYTLNGCEIGSAACLITTEQFPLIPTETTIFVPIEGLLALVTPALVLDPQDNEDLLQLPVVSREDY